MLRKPLIITFVFAIAGLCPASDPTSAQDSGGARKPNILLIMADDLGFSDLGCYGGEIETPNLDALAANGLRFTQFYNTARCWPTRSAILAGYYPQAIRRDKLPGVEKHGARGSRPKWAPLVSTLLQPQGYRSYHSGKWHVDGDVTANGFERSYHLKDQSRFFSPQVHFLDDEKLPPVERDTGYYGTIKVTDHAIECLEDHAKNHAEKPFFTYLAYAAPHFPLHALPEDIERYKDKYQEGWEVHRERRWQRIQEMGLLSGSLSAPERKLGPPYDFPDHLEILGDGEVNKPIPWDELTEQQKEFQSMKMAIHAAMIDCMDREIGRVLDKIREMGEFENTLILFLSDNGASAEIMVRADGHDPEAEPGSAPTYLCLGPGWSTVCNTPFRRHKTWTHEGGCSTPLIAHWPKGIAAKGEFRTNPGHVVDILPTLLEIAGTSPPTEYEGVSVPESHGKSLVPVFERDGTVDHDYIWWYHDEHRAVRQGDWKLVAAKKKPWSLYNMKTDRAEQTDLSAEHPAKAEELAKLWEDKVTEFANLAGSD
ncbi:MAG: arylsulfatase [Verrucomicrobiota bacterium]